MNVQESIQAVKDGTFREKIMAKRLAKDFLKNAAKKSAGTPTSSVAKGRELYETLHKKEG